MIVFNIGIVPVRIDILHREQLKTHVLYKFNASGVDCTLKVFPRQGDILKVDNPCEDRAVMENFILKNAHTIIDKIIEHGSNK